MALPERRMGVCVTRPALLALLLLVVAWAWSTARADAHIDWTQGTVFTASAIGRANLDGAGVEQSFIALGGHAVEEDTFGTVIEGQYLYWPDRPPTQ